MQQTETDERWYVQFDSGEVRLMTLEELDTAFEAGEVHENTYVIQVGETQWQTLSDVAGLDGDEEESADAAPPAAPAPAYTAPVPPQPQRPTQVAPAGRPVVAAAVGGWPPVAAPAAAPQSSWPPPATSVSSSGYNLGPQSMIPVVNDVDLDFDGRAFKSGRRTALIAAFAALPVLGGGIYGLTRLDVPAATPVAAAAAAPAPVQTASRWSGSADLEATPTPAPAPAAPPPESKDSGSTGRLSDDMKKALLASDQTRTPKQKARSAAPARRAAASKKGESSVFKAGGSTNDPLNSKL